MDPVEPLCQHVKEVISMWGDVKRWRFQTSGTCPFDLLFDGGLWLVTC